MSKSPRITPPEIAVTGHKRRGQIPGKTPVVPEGLRIHKPRAIAPRPQLSFSQPLLPNKNITSSQWPYPGLREVGYRSVQPKALSESRGTSLYLHISLRIPIQQDIGFVRRRKPKGKARVHS
ncbi:hypothetical protein BGX38DRAFT_228224 [Terfezia claveryi]|nr:hypothetical protein BGX38DRAFT_228224 [Terfezia claveryi]